MVKNLPAMQETQIQPLGWEDPLKKAMAAHFKNGYPSRMVSLPGESHGQSNLEGYNPYNCRVGHDRHSIAGKGNTIGPAQIRIKIHFAKHQKQN